MKQISNEIWAQIIPILNILAKKNYPRWMTTHPKYIRDHYDCFYCFICNKLIQKYYEWDDELIIDSTIQSVRRHGYQHIKERNLLPFI